MVYIKLHCIVNCKAKMHYIISNRIMPYHIVLYSNIRHGLCIAIIFKYIRVSTVNTGTNMKRCVYIYIYIYYYIYKYIHIYLFIPYASEHV